MSKSETLWEFYKLFPNAFSFTMTPKFDDDNQPIKPDFRPHVVITDAMTRFHKFMATNDVAIAQSDIECEESDPAEVYGKGKQTSKFFKEFCDYMLEPGIVGMRHSVRTYVLTAEGDSRAPAKDMTRIERTHAGREKKRFTEDERHELKTKMSYFADKPLLVDWGDVCGDYELRNFAMHQLAIESPQYLGLPPTRRVVFDGCVNKKYASKVEQEKGKRAVFLVEHDIESATIVERYPKSMVSSICEGEQSAVRWVKWACDEVPNCPRKHKSTKEVLVITNDTDAVMSLLQLVEHHMVKSDDGTEDDWRIGDKVFNGRVVMWFGRVNVVAATGARAPPPSQYAKHNLSPNDVIQTDMYIWINRLWYDIHNHINNQYASDLAMRLPIQPSAPAFPVIGLVSSLMFAANDFAPGLGFLTHPRMANTYIKYASWIGDLVRPDKAVSTEGATGDAHFALMLKKYVGVVDENAIIRLLTAAYYEAKSAQFKAFDHPGKVTDFDTVRKLVAKGCPKTPERHVPTTQELGGVLLRVLYHMAYNTLAPLDMAHLLDNDIEKYGYVKTTWTENGTTKEYFIPDNTELVIDEDTGTLRCLKKIRAPPKAKGAKRSAEGAPSGSAQSNAKRKK